MEKQKGLPFSAIRAITVRAVLTVVMATAANAQQTVTYPFPAQGWPSGFAPTVPTNLNETGSGCAPVNISFATSENVYPPFWYASYQGLPGDYLRAFTPWDPGYGGVFLSFSVYPTGDPLTVVNGTSQGQGTFSQTATTGTYPAVFGGGVGAKGTYTITVHGHVVTEQYALNVQFSGPTASGSANQSNSYAIQSGYDVQSGVQTYSFGLNVNSSESDTFHNCVQTTVLNETGTTSINWNTRTGGSVQITSLKISQGQPPDDGSATGEVALVLGRPAALQVQGTTSGSAPETIDLNITVGGQSFDFPNVSIADLTGTSGANGGNGVFLRFIATDPTAQTVSVSSSTSGVNVTASPINVQAFTSGPTRYTYVNLEDGSYTLSNNDFSVMAGISDSYVVGVLPINLSNYKPSYSSLAYDPTALQLNSCLSTACDAIDDLNTLADLLGVDRVIGIAPDDWMNRVVGSVVVGYAYPNLPGGAVVRNGFPQATAHELGHTYGLYDKGELYDPTTGACPPGPDNPSPFAYWVEKPVQTAFLGTNLENYMCSSAPSDPLFAGNNPDHWTTTTDWKTVGQYLISADFDPPVLIVNGFIDNTGHASFRSLYRNPQGTVEGTIPSGAYAVQVLSRSGAVLSSVSFAPSFSILDVPNVVLPLSPFGFKLAYPPNALAVRIMNGTSVVASENIASGLLLTAVQNLQDAAFVATPTQHRIALVSMVNALNTQITTGNVTGAQQFLTNAIRTQISSWVSDSYAAPNPLFYTKASLLSLVDELAQRLSTAQ